MGDFFARFSEFGSAIIGYWYVWITGAPFVIDQGLSHKYLPKRVVDLADKWWPPEGRHRILKWICAAGFVVASFQVFDNINTELKTVRAQPPALTANRWEPLRSNEIIALRAEFRALPREHLNVLCAFAGCYDLADSIFSIANDLKWTGTYEGSYFSDRDIAQGIQIDSYSKKNDVRKRIIEAIERATKGRLKIAFYERTDSAHLLPKSRTI
jgi:hypothetical protein